MPRIVGTARNSSAVSVASLDLDVPSNVEDGDVIYVELDGVGPTTWSEASGDWTSLVSEVTSGGGQNFGLTVFRQVVADATALPASYTFDQSPSRACIGSLYVVRGADNADPETVGTPTVQNTAATTLAMDGVSAQAEGLLLALANFPEESLFDDTIIGIDDRLVSVSRSYGGMTETEAGTTSTVTLTNHISTDAAKGIGVQIAINPDGSDSGARVAFGKASETVAPGSTTHTVDMPTHADGDRLVVFGSFFGATTVTPPAGWTEVEFGNTNQATGVWYRTASAEPASYEWTTGAAGTAAVMAISVKNAGALDQVGAIVTSTGSTITLSEITPTGQGIVFGAIGANGERFLTSVPDTTQGGYWASDSSDDSAVAFGFEAHGATATGTRVYGMAGPKDGFLFNFLEAASAPAAPTNPAATALSASSIEVTWDNVSDETGYRVERSADGSSGWSDVSGNLAADTTSYEDTGLAAETEFFYRVVAFNDAGDSDPSDVVSATTQSSAGGGNRIGGTGAIRKPPRRSR